MAQDFAAIEVKESVLVVLVLRGHRHGCCYRNLPPDGLGGAGGLVDGPHGGETHKESQDDDNADHESCFLVLSGRRPVLAGVLLLALRRDRLPYLTFLFQSPVAGGFRSYCGRSGLLSPQVVLAAFLGVGRRLSRGI
jgi:hypothetical protein